MTELELYKFITNNNCEWNDINEDIILFIDIDNLLEFTRLIQRFLEKDPYVILMNILKI